MEKNDKKYGDLHKIIYIIQAAGLVLAAALP